MTQNNIEELIVCATDDKASYIPAIVCETYLLNYRGHGADLQYLKTRTGLNFLTNIEDVSIRNQLFKFFIGRGMNINAVSPVDGLTPLHAAVLLNDSELARFLIKQGANPRVREKNSALTPLEYLDLMNAQYPGINRDKTRQALSH